MRDERQAGTEPGREAPRAESAAGARAAGGGRTGGLSPDHKLKKKPQRKQTWNLIPAHRPADSTMGAGASSRSEMSELFSVYTKVHSTDIYSFVQNKINVICHHKNLYSREETCSRGRSWGPH